MGSLLPAHQANAHIRSHSRGLGAGTLNVPLAEASRPFSEWSLLKSAVVNVHAVKSMKDRGKD
jgi:hypothetical protein